MDRLHAVFQNLIGQIEASGAIAVVDESFEVSENPLEFDIQMEEHCLEVGPVQLSGDALTMEFESLSHAIDAWKGGYDASALARRDAEKLAETTLAAGKVRGLMIYNSEGARQWRDQGARFITVPFESIMTAAMTKFLEESKQ